MCDVNLYQFVCVWSVYVKEKEKGMHTLLTKAIEFARPALPNAPNIGLIITCKIRFPSLVEAFLIKVKHLQEDRLHIHFPCCALSHIT